MTSPDYLIAYEPTDEAWGAWVVQGLREIGRASALRLDEPPSRLALRLFVVYSRRAAASTRIREYIGHAQLAERGVVLVVVEDNDVPLPEPPYAVIRLTVPGEPLDRLRERLLGRDLEEPAAPSRHGFVTRPGPPESFVNRTPELEALTAAITGASGPAKVVVTGPPGIGKTALVAAFAQRIAGPTYEVRWISAAGTRLDRLPPQPSARPFTVLVIDGAADHRSVVRALPTDERTHVVITSRSHLWPFQMIRLGELAQHPSVDLLFRTVPHIGPVVSLMLWRKLGGIPGVLTAAATVLSRAPDIREPLAELAMLEDTVRDAGEEGAYYLDTDDPRVISSFERAFVELAGGVELRTVYRGSWTRLWRRADRAAEVMALARPEGEANKSNAEAIATLMQASAAITNAVICSGSIIFVKSTDDRGRTHAFAKTLTPEELHQFEDQPHLLTSPAQALDFLQALRPLPEAGSM